MTSQSGERRFDWRRPVGAGLAGGAIAAMLMVGVAATASAQPAQPTETETPSASSDTRAPGENCTGDDCKKPVAGEPQEPEPKKMSADEVLSIIYNQYRQGDGGGQVSKLIDDAMRLRAQGFRPSNANVAALTDALERRPNQTPLVEALKDTVAYQRKLQAQAAMSTDGSSGGQIQMPVVIGPNAGINVPIG